MFTGNDTAVSTDVAMLESLDKASQELAVTGMLDQAKQWLDRAMEATNPAREVADFKAFVATVAEAAKQKKLSEGIQLESTEMVRRSERALGVAIRKGQDAGEVANTATAAAAREARKRTESTASHLDAVVSPNEFFSHHQERADTYNMTDNVSDEQFEEAVADAKFEENMSRANVVRHVKQIKERDERVALSSAAHREDMQAWHESLAERYQLPRLAFDAEGHERHESLAAFQGAATSRYGVKYRHTEKSYAKHAAQSGDWLERSSMNLEVALDVLSHIDFSTITPEQATEALQRIESVPRQLNLFIRTLKEITNE